jgi:hypothetical protein
MLKNAFFALSLIATLLIVVPLQASAALSEKDTRDIAREAYVFGTPMVDTYRVMYAFSIDKTNPQYKGRSITFSTSRGYLLPLTRLSSHPTPIRPTRSAAWTCGQNRS